MKLAGLIVLSSIFFLSACGGGGGSSDSAQASTPFSVNAGFSASVLAIAVEQNSNDIYAAGNFNSYNGTASKKLVRLNRDGSIDTNFNVGTGFNRAVHAIAVATDGSGGIYVGGDFTSYKGVSVTRVVRLNSDGSVDSDFNTGSGPNGGLGVDAITVATDGSGDIYVGGNFNAYNGVSAAGLVRLNNDGSYDTGFDLGSGFAGSVSDIAIATDGSNDVYAAGGFSSYDGNTLANIVRINSDGSYDTGFSTGSGFSSFVSAIAIATDGSGDIYAGGNFFIYRGNSRNRIARINSDGSNDAGFNPGSGANNVIRTVAIAPDGSGNLYIGGGFTAFNGLAASGMACLEPTGIRCVSFNSGLGFNGTIMSIVSANDGRGGVYVGGNFNSYDSVGLDNFSLLDSSGQLQ